MYYNVVIDKFDTSVLEKRVQNHPNKAVYTAFVAPRRPKSKSVTEWVTYGRTDTRSYRVASS